MLKELGSEFAKVDEKDTPDNQRYIKSATTIYDINDINKTWFKFYYFSLYSR
ncbi:hypothetical protein [Lebetimonas sp. JS138]|uniref:hypothetical protein n=1 Tax=Lebetimonas sp. JS138 TaxID=990072 RepID=UPI0004AD5556|nr:hypothetical protein [Lebetimonas sp. JS138]